MSHKYKWDNNKKDSFLTIIKSDDICISFDKEEKKLFKVFDSIVSDILWYKLIKLG